MFIRSVLFRNGHPLKVEARLADVLEGHKKKLIAKIKAVTSLKDMTDPFLAGLVNQGDVNNAVAANGNVAQSVGNKGDVNNAVAASGTIAQTAGDENKVKVEQPKESFLAQGWKKVVTLWMKIFG